jgi:hypothetical protein
MRFKTATAVDAENQHPFRTKTQAQAVAQQKQVGGVTNARQPLVDQRNVTNHHRVEKGHPVELHKPQEIDGIKATSVS